MLHIRGGYVLGTVLGATPAGGWKITIETCAALDWTPIDFLYGVLESISPAVSGAV